jgi:hypothetical protein
MQASVTAPYYFFNLSQKRPLEEEYYSRMVIFIAEGAIQALAMKKGAKMPLLQPNSYPHYPRGKFLINYSFEP